METSSDGGGERKWLLVSYAVGQNANNWWDDIMLVQYYIRTIYELNGVLGIPVWNISNVSLNDLKDLPEPRRDYKNLKKTAKWIRYFQSDAILENSTPLLADGRVDAHSALGASTASKLYTIHVLNLIYQHSLANVGIEDWLSFAKISTEVPSLLKSKLSKF